jgi:hypothetical protein
MVDPKRVCDLKLTMLPHLKKSSTDIELPDRNMPYMDRVEPMRIRDLKLTFEPICAASSTLKEDPSLAIP